MKKRKRFKFFLTAFTFLVFVLSFSFFVFSFKRVFAQQLSLSLSPPLLEVMAQPGKSLTQVYKIANKGEVGVYLTSKIVPFSPADNQGGSRFDFNQTIQIKGLKFSLTNAYLDLGETFFLKPGEERELVLKINVLPLAEEKDYYFAFFVEQSGEGLFLAPGSQAVSKIGSHILLSVSRSGQPKQTLSITRFSAVPKIGDSFSKTAFKLIISNQGKYFLKPMGRIDLFDWRGKKRGELKLRPDNILAQSQREIVCLDQEGGCYFRSFWPGRWRAVLTVHPDLWPQEEKTAVVVFWLFPWKLMLALLTAVVVLVLIFRRLRNGEKEVGVS